MQNMTKTSIAVALSLAAFSASSANIVADGRGNGMGNTGVTSADFLLAPFYNPALVAVHREEDDFGLLLPSIGVTAKDTDETLTQIEDLQDAIDNNQGSVNDAEVDRLLNEIKGNSPVAVTAGAGVAVAFPIKALSANLFTRGYAEVIAVPDVDTSGNTSENVEASEVHMAAFGYSEFGLALAKRVTLGGHDVSFGITPKYQKLMTYQESANINDFDIEDYDQSEVSKSAFNVDLGAVWMLDHYRVGIAIKDLLAQEVKTFDGSDTYNLDTQVTLSGAYAMEFFTATVDWDVTKQERFAQLADDTQFLRFGVEGNAWGWGQLRAGYEMDLEDTLDDSITAGIGISPGDLVSLDIAASYAGDNQFGVGGNLAFTF
ncbi:conjugal transfer protein TraF [Vibrio crassostreae]|uniref:conjugal transfer protein TraF n=1 Tax=Vibrio crassostreae TaxID=246167 RepID=UPI001B312FD2|nr:conjugal transfer protein TraF [Vibrio crassostreae]